MRWLRDPRYARDYARYWFRTPGAQPRNYSTWLADAVWAVHDVHPDKAFITDLLPDLVKNYDGWAKRQWVPEVGLFWQIGHDDGMEFNINSRQTKDILRGAPGYRPSFNAYMWADALAIAHVADLAGDAQTADAFRAKAAGIKEQLQKRLWDPKTRVLLPDVPRRRAGQGGQRRQGRHADLPDRQVRRQPARPRGDRLRPVAVQPARPRLRGGLEVPDGPATTSTPTAGPTTVERNDPMFLLQKSCCWWSGQSWPYATTQTLKAMANLLQNYDQNVVTRADYLKLLRNYALSHRKDGKPYLAEALHPDTGSFEGHDGYNHSEHYFHSGFCDLVITGLVGLKPQDGDTLEIDPLAPAEWDYFALDDVPYRGHRLAVLWDSTGTRYGRGAGLHVLADGKEIASSPTLGKLTVKLPPTPERRRRPPNPRSRMNYAVNNDGDYFPRLTASFVAPGTSLSKLQRRQLLVHQGPAQPLDRAPARPNACGLGRRRLRHAAAHRHGQALLPRRRRRQSSRPARYELEVLGRLARGSRSPARSGRPSSPTGHRPNVVTFPPTEVQKFRVVFTHAAGGKTGLTEIEAWGDGSRPIRPAPPPAGNLAYNPKGEGFPKATASFSDLFGGTPDKAIDGKIIFLPTPMNRWTSYGSPNATDWLEVDFGAEKEVGRVGLHIYDDRGGVQPPQRYVVQAWVGGEWRDVEGQAVEPEAPTGGMANTVTFKPVKTSKIRVVFTHKGKARSGVTEIEAWRGSRAAAQREPLPARRRHPGSARIRTCPPSSAGT